MTTGRKTLDDLLAPISAQLGRERVSDEVALPEWDVRPARVTDGLGEAELVDLFAAEAQKVRVQVRRCARADLAACVAQVVGEGVPGSGEPAGVIVAQDDRFADAGLEDALRAQPRVAGVAAWDESAGAANVAVAKVATYGITYAQAGIAETATVVQPCGPRCGRAVSLLPLVHVAVVDADSIVPTMREALLGLEGAGELPSQVCFISGPSATADIELVRVEGVHGPMYVCYVIVE